MPRRGLNQREGNWHGANTNTQSTDDLEPNGDLGLGDALELLLDPSRKQAREDKDRQWQRISEAFRLKDVSGFLDRHEDRLFEALKNGLKTIDQHYLTALGLIQLTVGPDPRFLDLLAQLSTILKNPADHAPELPPATLLAVSLIVFVSGENPAVLKTVEFARELLADGPSEATLLSLALLISVLKPDQAAPMVPTLVPDLVPALSESVEEKVAAAVTLGLLAHQSRALEFTEEPLRKHPHWQKVDHERLKYAIQNWSQGVSALQKQRHRALFADLIEEQQQPADVSDDFNLGDNPVPVRGWVSRARLACLRHVLATGFLHHAATNDLFASIVETDIDDRLSKGEARERSAERHLRNSRQRNDDRRRKYDLGDE